MTVKDLGPLDWKTPIVTPEGTPTPEFQRRWQTQRENNTFIGSVTLGSGAPSGTPADGAEYLDISTTPFTLYAGSGGSWHRVSAVKFTDLLDVPNSYTAQGGKVLRVNAGATAVEFVATTTLLDALSSTQGAVLYRGASTWTALAPGTAGQVLTTGGPSANPSWMPGGGGGGGRNTEATWTTPLKASFTARNPTNAVVNNGTNGLTVANNVAATAGIEPWGLTAGPPATPYDVCARFWMNTDNSNFPEFGIYVRNAGSGNLYTLGFYTENSGFGWGYVVQSWTGFNAGQGGHFNYAPTGQTRTPLWWRINNDGTNLNFYISNDGWDWIKIATDTLAAFITSVTDVGFYSYGGSGTATFAQAV